MQLYFGAVPATQKRWPGRLRSAGQGVSRSLNTREAAMSDLQLIRNCAPTLAGMKVGSLFNVMEKEEAQVNFWLERWNALLNGKGVHVRCLKYTGSAALMYVYRMEALDEQLSQPAVQALMRQMNYPAGGSVRQIDHLAAHLKNHSEFPHEIGLFLGYPREDVWGFMCKKGRDYKCSGCWKVYGDAEKAKACFAKYRRCTNHFVKHYKNGVTL